MQGLQPSLDGYASRLIKFKARQLSRRAGFSACDREDIEQDLTLDLLERLPRYDPAKASLNTFVARIVDHKVVSILRFQQAAKRNRGREDCSLNDPVRDTDGRLVDRHQTTPEAANVPQQLRELEHDVAELLADLPELQRAIALGLGTGTVNAVSIDLGLSRSAVKRQIAAMRARFEDVGLRHYL